MRILSDEGRFQSQPSASANDSALGQLLRLKGVVMTTFQGVKAFVSPELSGKGGRRPAQFLGYGSQGFLLPQSILYFYALLHI